jgi:hypothetical protein
MLQHGHGAGSTRWRRRTTLRVFGAGLGCGWDTNSVKLSLWQRHLTLIPALSEGGCDGQGVTATG